MNEEKYIKYLETHLEASEMEHKHDMQMIDDLKGELVKVYKHIDIIKDKLKNDMKCAKEKIKYYEMRYRNEESEFYKKSHHRQINRWQSRYETLREFLNFMEEITVIG